MDISTGQILIFHIQNFELGNEILIFNLIVYDGLKIDPWTHPLL